MGQSGVMSFPWLMKCTNSMELKKYSTICPPMHTPSSKLVYDGLLLAGSFVLTKTIVNF